MEELLEQLSTKIQDAIDAAEELMNEANQLGATEVATEIDAV